MSHDDFAFEPVRGLPEHLPEGEKLLWQGEPRWQTLARRAFRVRAVAIYFALLLVWQFATAIADGRGLSTALISTAWVATLALVALGLLVLLGWLYARSTVYSITDQRVVMRFGVAIPLTINIPFSRIESADFTVYADGTGDIPLTLVDGERIGFLVLWPNVRPWSFSRTRPMLRSIPDAARVAQILADALAVTADSAAPQVIEQRPQRAANDSAPSPLATAAR